MTTTAPPDDEFYIGYEGEMPPRARRRVRQALTAATAVGVTMLVTILVSTSRLLPSRFDFGLVTELDGTLHRSPYPVLEDDGGRVWLVGAGKWAADAALARVADGPVRLRGQRIERAGIRMFEVLEARPASTGMRTASRSAHQATRFVTLRGEIVDSKCFLGVMNPAEGVVHRDCARRCLSGGIPPMLLVRDGLAREQLVALVSSTGERMPELRPLAGSTVTVSGRLTGGGNDYVLYLETWKKR